MPKYLFQASYTTQGAEAQQGSTDSPQPTDGAARPDGGSGTPPSQTASIV